MKAYFVGGHGSNPVSFGKKSPNDTFIVPDGCVIIAKARPGEIVQSFFHYQLIKKLCDKKSLDKFKNPLHHIPFIISTFGSSMVGPDHSSVSIYTAGEECPNFSYTLMMCHSGSSMIEDDTSISRCPLAGSGLIDLDKWPEDVCSSETHTKNMIQKSRNREFAYSSREKRKAVYTKSDTIFADLYKYSIKPTQDEIYSVLEKMKDEYDFSKILKNQDFYKLVKTDQKTLCGLFPGVYYNFSCRSIRFGDKKEIPISKYTYTYKIIRNNVEYPDIDPQYRNQFADVGASYREKERLSLLSNAALHQGAYTYLDALASAHDRPDIIELIEWIKKNNLNPFDVSVTMKGIEKTSIDNAIKKNQPSEAVLYLIEGLRKDTLPFSIIAPDTKRGPSKLELMRANLLRRQIENAELHRKKWIKEATNAEQLNKAIRHQEDLEWKELASKVPIQNNEGRLQAEMAVGHYMGGKRKRSTRKLNRISRRRSTRKRTITSKEFG